MTETEMRRVERAKRPSHSPGYTRRAKLKMRFGYRLDSEIDRTREKLDMLLELRNGA